MSIVSLKTELRQQMKLTPQLLQSIELLQMNSQELLSYLGRMAEKNPTMELRTAEKAIAALKPRPGRAFQLQEPIALARLDVFVLETDGELQVVLNEFYLPKVSVSSYYSDMSRSVEDQEARAYLKEKLRQEDPAHPLSDQALCALLEQEGIHLARRTVAKCRMEQGVGSSAVRRV